jgi:nucleoside-diphosphate-sugar epimerase
MENVKERTAVVFGAGGFIGGHLVKRLLSEGYVVRAVDIKAKKNWWQVHDGTEIVDCHDLTSDSIFQMVTGMDEVYQLAADMGGAGYIFTGENDANVMTNSALINLRLVNQLAKMPEEIKVFYSSSACIYPARNQTDPDNPNCAEDSAYPADPDSDYGWEKLFSERLYKAYERNYSLPVRIARFHNIFGPQGSWEDGKEKAPAAMCRKAAEDTEVMEVWGPGTQTRSFLYIDDCLDAVRALMESDCTEIINIGSEEMVSINHLASLAIDISGQKKNIKNIPGPVGVMGRCSDNKLIQNLLGWTPKYSLEEGMKLTFAYIKQEMTDVEKMRRKIKQPT